MLSEYGLEVVEGQSLDINLRADRAPTEEAYVACTAKKTGGFFAIAIVGGGVIGGATDHQLDDLGVFAREAGVAFQIKDDLLDVVGGKGRRLGSDVAEGKRTVLAAYALERAHGAEQRRLIDILDLPRDRTTESDIAWVHGLYTRTGARVRAEAAAERRLVSRDRAPAEPSADGCAIPLPAAVPLPDAESQLSALPWPRHRRARGGPESLPELGSPQYSQGNEELLIRRFFGHRRGGIFVDVGAGHWCDGSNTYGLERHLSWTGIAVDGLAGLEDGYRCNRPRTTFLNYVVTDHCAPSEPFYVAGCLSSTKKEHLASFPNVDADKARSSACQRSPSRISSTGKGSCVSISSRWTSSKASRRR